MSTLAGWCTAAPGARIPHAPFCQSDTCPCWCHGDRQEATTSDSSHRDGPNSGSVDTDADAPVAGAQT